MTTPAASQPRSIGQLAWEIRIAWTVASAAVPAPAGIIDADPDNPVVTSALDARHTAFEWALNELIDGDYQAPQSQVDALRNGVLPDMRRARDGSHG
jgi:hypothetical protein